MEFIEFNEQQKKIVTALKDKEKVARTAFVQASILLEEVNDRFWKRMHELFPQTKDYKDAQIIEGGALLLMDKKNTQPGAPVERREVTASRASGTKGINKEKGGKGAAN